jgi:hypothetical protein
MYRIIITTVFILIMSGCSNPKSVVLPTQLDKMDTIKTQMEKLTPEERELVAGYIMRHTIGSKLSGLLGGKEVPGIPEGMTLGKAIDEQRKFKAEVQEEELKQAMLKAKLKAAQDAALSKMRDAVTATIISKAVDTERGYSGMALDEKIVVKFGFKNNTDKDMAGIKGTVDVNDLFDDELCGFSISYDKTIRAGETATWMGSRSIRFGMNSSKDRKFGEMEEGKYKVLWKPEIIVFADGSKLTLPKE